MNGSFGFVLCLIAIVMCAGIIKTYMKQQRPEPRSDDELVETLEKVDALEERIQVLERIVTESRHDLKREIDSL